MRSVLTILVLIQPLAGCAVALGAAQPPGFAETAREVPIDHAFFGTSGTSLAGYTLDSGLNFSKQVSGFDGDELDSSDNVAITRGDAPVWAVECTSRLDSAVVPVTQLVCVYLAATPSDPPLSLALTSSAGTPLAGVFFAAGSTWTVDGSMTPSAGEALHPDTVGYAVRRLGQAEVALFIDAAWPHLAAWAAPSLTPDELHALAPMLLVMAHVKDPRWLLRNQGGAGGYRLTSTDEGWVAGSRARTASDARRLPLPPPTHAGMTANEAHAAKLTELGYPDAARALWAALMAQRGSGS